MASMAGAPPPAPASGSSGDSPGVYDRGSQQGTPFSALYARNKDKPLRVNGVTAHGADRTDKSVLNRELKRVAEAKTLHEVTAELLAATNRLQALDVFRTVDVAVDAGPANRPNTCDVYLTVRERDMLAFDVGTFVQGNEVTAEGTLKLVNPFGYAERVHLEANAGHTRSGTFSLGYQLPRVGGSESTLDVRAFQSLQHHNRHSSFSETRRGMSAQVSTPANGTTVGYELSWREVGGTGADAKHLCSNAVRDQLGNRLKSSVYASAATQDTRTYDAVGVRPVSGTAGRVNAELAGVGFSGSRASALVRHARAEAEAAASVPLNVLGPDVALTLGVRTGVLLPLGGPGESTYIVDRFYLGGPTGPMRGFVQKGCGPSDARRLAKDGKGESAPEALEAGGAGIGRDSLGGDVMAMASASLAFPLPHRALTDAGVYAHAFTDVGAVVPLSASSGSFAGALADAGRSLAASPRATVGFGLAWGIGRFGRLELNYVHAVSSQVHDGVKRGVQVGFASSGLF